MYDKDWEVHLALNNPLDPIHGYMEDYLEKEEQARRDRPSHSPRPAQRDHPRPEHGAELDQPRPQSRVKKSDRSTVTGSPADRDRRQA